MRIAVMFVVGCGASPAVQPAPTTSNTNQVERERLRREELSAAQNVRLDEQATALAATCQQADQVTPRCLPTCYAAESATAHKHVAGIVEIPHVVCTRADSGPYLLVDELGKLDVRVVRRFPKASKRGTWQAEVEGAVSTALEPELGRGDLVRVTGNWRPITHPVTRERLRCAAVSHFTRSMRLPLDACGARGAIGCEANGNAAAHGLNVVHYRLLEARRLQADGKSTECQQAALEAVAVARGMPRWRQYITLNTDQWKAFKRYRTRFDGVIDEDTLFATTIALGTDAEAVYRACGGTNPKTVASDEQSFHTCW